jgi:hypothetical protein
MSLTPHTFNWNGTWSTVPAPTRFLLVDEIDEICQPTNTNEYRKKELLQIIKSVHHIIHGIHVGANSVHDEAEYRNRVEVLKDYINRF